MSSHKLSSKNNYCWRQKRLQAARQFFAIRRVYLACAPETTKIHSPWTKSGTRSRNAPTCKRRAERVHIISDARTISVVEKSRRTLHKVLLSPQQNKPLFLAIWVRPCRNGTLGIFILGMLLFAPFTTTWTFFANLKIPARKDRCRVCRCIFVKERPGNKNSAMVAQKRRNNAEISVYYFVESISMDSSETLTGISIWTFPIRSKNHSGERRKCIIGECPCNQRQRL